MKLSLFCKYRHKITNITQNNKENQSFFKAVGLLLLAIALALVYVPQIYTTFTRK